MILPHIRLLAFCFAVAFLCSCGSSRKTTQHTAAPHKLTRALKHKYADILHVRPKDIRNKKLFLFLESWKNVTYKYGGNSLQEGTDCSGFVHQLYQSVYDLNVKRNAAQLYEESKHIRQRKLKEGNLVFFITLGGKKVSHVGVYLTNNYFVHLNNKGLLFTNLDESYWKKHFKAAGKITKSIDK